MTLETEFAPADAPMAKLLSVILIIGQWVLGLSIILILITAILFSLPETMSISIKADLPGQLNGATMIGNLMSGAIIAAGWFFVLRFLRQVVSSLIHGDPFSPENIARLRLILILIIATELVRIFSLFIFGSVGDVEGIKRLDIRIGTWFFIFIIAAISEAFRYGAALRAEQELTI